MPVLIAVLAVLALLLAAAPAAAAAATPEVHAHRGGSVLDGVPAFPEETMPAFRHAALVERVWLELDVKLTQDAVPVVLHDDTLDRTTACTGPVVARTFAALAACPADRDGSPGSSLPDAPAKRPEPLPRLDEVLAFAKEAGAGVNVEIKNQPGDGDYDPTGRVAETVMRTIAAARLDPARLIVQSFDPSNLDVAERVLPGVQQSFLTLAPSNEPGPAYARARGYEWISPGGVPSAAYVERARGLGLRVVPYTLNTPADVRAAAANGVDALITDDPVMARKALGRAAPAPATAAAPVPATAAPAPPPAPAARAALLPRAARTVLRRGGFAVRLTGPPRTARLTVTPRGRRTPVLARLTVVKRGAGPRRALVRLTPAGRRALRARPGLRVALRGQ